jgi:uncharacterized phage infection (PIP) family protein YhgE
MTSQDIDALQVLTEKVKQDHKAFEQARVERDQAQQARQEADKLLKQKESEYNTAAQKCGESWRALKAFEPK